METRPPHRVRRVMPLRVSVERLEAMADVIRSSWLHGELDNEACILALYAVSGCDGAGDLWTMGVQTGRWYRRTQDSWTIGQPTGPLIVPVLPNVYAQLVRDLSAPAYDSGGRQTPSLAGAAGDTPGASATEIAPVAGSTAPLPAGEQASFCVACGAPLLSSARFCTHCGAQSR